MNLSEDHYISEYDEFGFIKKGDAIGPETYFVWKKCVTFRKYSPATE